MLSVASCKDRRTLLTLESGDIDDYHELANSKLGNSCVSAEKTDKVSLGLDGRVGYC